jgi:hypothetical protein
VTYTVDVLEPCDAKSVYASQTAHGPDWGVGIDGLVGPTCGSGFDFVAGSSFFVGIDGTLDGGVCYSFSASASQVPAVKEVLQSKGAGGISESGFVNIRALDVYMTSGCRGSWNAALLYTHHGTPTTAPVPGQSPAVLMIRRFWLEDFDAGAAGCALPSDSELMATGYCADAFVVGMKK